MRRATQKNSSSSSHGSGSKEEYEQGEEHLKQEEGSPREKHAVFWTFCKGSCLEPSWFWAWVL